MAKQGLVLVGAVGEFGDRLFGDDEYVYRGLGVDVLEGQAEVVFKDDVGGDVAVDDLAENRVGHGLGIVPLSTKVFRFFPNREGVFGVFCTVDFSLILGGDIGAKRRFLPILYETI